MASLLLAGASTAWAQYDMSKKVNEVPDFVPNAAPDYSLMKPKTSRFLAGGKAAQRPDHWNNTLLKYFPPYFNQAGPSCMGSSYVGYIFTNETNSYRGVDGSLDENQYAVFFNWLLTNGHSSKNTMLTTVGNPNSVVYGGRTYSTKIGYQEWSELDFGWMQGYDKWFHAMHNRITGISTFPATALTEEGREAVKQWVWNHNGDTDFHGGGVCYVILGISGSKSGSIGNTPANKAAGVVGKSYLACWSEKMDHAMTIAGYDDRIEFDLDSNGVYGEPEKDEVGAWVVVNSWGGSWGNGGWFYVPYARSCQVRYNTYPWNPEVQHVRKNYRPKRTVKITMDYSDRREIRLYAGIATDTAATKPEKTIEFDHFKYVGRGYTGSVPCPMLGRWVDGYHYEPMEFGYDLTDLSANFDHSKPLKYFFWVATTNYYSDIQDSGHIYNCSIIDYDFDLKGIEFPMTTETVYIPGNGKTTTLTTIVQGDALGKPLNLQLSDEGILSWTAAPDGILPVQRYYIYADDEKIDSVDASATTYQTSPAIKAGYTVKALYANETLREESEPSNRVFNYEIELPTGTNKVFTFTDGGFSIPDVFTTPLDKATIEFWYNTKKSYNYNQNMGPGWGSFYFHACSGGAIYFGWDTTAGDRSANNTQILKNNSWQHIALVVDGGTMILYVNGLKKAELKSSSYSGLPAMKNFVFKALDGSMDELRIWNRARTVREIYQSYKLEVANPANQDGLLAYYKMDTVEEDGMLKLRDCVSNHHAPLSGTDNAVQADANANFLSGTAKIVRPIIYADGEKPVEGGTAVTFASYDLVTTKSWCWTFPEIGVENLKLSRPTVIFPSAGTYTAKLTITDKDGETADTTTTYTVKSADMPTADFEIPTTTMPAGDHFSFLNRSKGSNCTYTWSFPGAQVETMHSFNATATYDEVGEHTVTLTVKNTAGESSISKTVNVTMVSPKVQFQVSPLSVVKGEKVYLTDKSKYSPSAWLWEIYNDKHCYGTRTQNTSWTPTVPGYYSVKLRATNEMGDGVGEEENIILVTNADSKAGLQFGGENNKLTMTDICKDETRYFTIDFWLRPTDLSEGFALSNEGTGLNLKCDAYGALTASIGTKNCTSGNNYMISGEWHHYAITYSLGKIVFYRDGIKFAAPNTTLASGTAKQTFSGQTVLGGMKSAIDEFRYWNSCLSSNNIQHYCNAPITNVDSAMTTNKLVLYYDFNHDSGNAIDRTPNGVTGYRSGFGPDGDAWINSIGVFSLDFSTTVTATDVTATYLKNYKAPFLSTGKKLMPNSTRFVELETETERSPWVMKNWVVIDDTTTAVHIDRDKGNELTLETTWSNFASSIKNHLLYQTVTLPAGYYDFSYVHDRSDSKDPSSSYLVATLGDTLCWMGDIDNTLAAGTMSKMNSISFFVPTETNVSLGIIWNMSGRTSMSVQSFNLKSKNIEMFEGDNLTGIRDEINKGLRAPISGERNGIRVVTDEMITLKVYDLQGRCVLNEYVCGNKLIPMPAGTYIANGVKVLVR